MTSAAASSPAAQRRALLALAGFSVCLAAPVAWMATLDVPFLMHSGLAAWVCLTAGIALGVAAVRRDPRTRVRVLLGLDLALAAFVAWGAFGFARLPAPDKTFERAPEFDLVDHHGKPVRLSDELARGPVLLVFFRGSW